MLVFSHSDLVQESDRRLDEDRVGGMDDFKFITTDGNKIIKLIKDETEELVGFAEEGYFGKFYFEIVDPKTSMFVKLRGNIGEEEQFDGNLVIVDGPLRTGEEYEDMMAQKLKPWFFEYTGNTLRDEGYNEEIVPVADLRWEDISDRFGTYTSLPMKRKIDAIEHFGRSKLVKLLIVPGPPGGTQEDFPQPPIFVRDALYGTGVVEFPVENLRFTGNMKEVKLKDMNYPNRPRGLLLRTYGEMDPQKVFRKNLKLALQGFSQATIRKFLPQDAAYDLVSPDIVTMPIEFYIKMQKK